MAQNDMNVANQGFPAFRADLNDQLEALVTNSSGATAPATTFPHQFWVDTSVTPNILRQRNADNDAWIVIGSINQANDTFNLAVAQGGTGAATLAANAVLLGNGTSAVQTVAPGSSGNVLTSNGTTWQSTAFGGNFTNISYTGTLTGGTGVVNIGSGQFTKDANGLVIIRGDITQRVLRVLGGLGMEVNEDNAGTKVLALRSDFAGAGPAVSVTTNDPLLFCTNNVIRAQIASNGAQSSVIPGGVTLYPEFKCRAWVNFDGFSNILASGNVSSVTKNGAGDFTINFATAMVDNNYAAAYGARYITATIGALVCETTGTTRSTTSLQIRTGNSGNFTALDFPSTQVSVFR